MNSVLRLKNRFGRPPAYDLRRRVLLKNFLREQMSILPSVFTAESDDDPPEQKFENNCQSSVNSKENCNITEMVDDEQENGTVDCSNDLGLTGNGVVVTEPESDYGFQPEPGQLNSNFTGAIFDNEVFTNNKTVVNTEEPQRKRKRKFLWKRPSTFVKKKTGGVSDGFKFHLKKRSKPKPSIQMVRSPTKRSSMRVKFKQLFTPYSEDGVDSSEEAPVDEPPKNAGKPKSFFKRLFQTKDCSSSGGSLDSPDDSKSGKREAVVENCSVSVQTDMSYIDDSGIRSRNRLDSYHLSLRRENKRLRSDLHYLMSFHESKPKYWLRSVEKDNDTGPKVLRSSNHFVNNSAECENLSIQYKNAYTNCSFSSIEDRENGVVLMKSAKVTRSKSVEESTFERHPRYGCARNVYVPCNLRLQKVTPLRPHPSRTFRQCHCCVAGKTVHRSLSLEERPTTRTSITRRSSLKEPGPSHEVVFADEV